MSDDAQNKKGGDGKKKPPGNFEFPVSTWLVWILIIGSIVALVAVQSKDADAEQPDHHERRILPEIRRGIDRARDD